MSHGQKGVSIIIPSVFTERPAEDNKKGNQYTNYDGNQYTIYDVAVPLLQLYMCKTDYVHYISFFIYSVFLHVLCFLHLCGRLFPGTKKS